MKPSVRVARFVTVGGLGFAVQAATLSLLTTAVHWPWPLAIASAVEAAIVHNFVWHQRWTWRDRGTESTWSFRFRRFARYNVATGVLAIAGNVAVTGLFLALLDLPIVIANLCAVLTLTVASFFVADRWIF